jgi:hypothetical protein
MGIIAKRMPRENPRANSGPVLEYRARFQNPLTLCYEARTVSKYPELADRLPRCVTPPELLVAPSQTCVPLLIADGSRPRLVPRWGIHRDRGRNRPAFQSTTIPIYTFQRSSYPFTNRGRRRGDGSGFRRGIGGTPRRGRTRFKEDSQWKGARGGGYGSSVGDRNNERAYEDNG